MKKLLLILSVPLVAIVIAVAALVFLVDANQFKPLIVEQTKKQTGLDLVIEGDIGWRVFPSVGLSLGKTELKNPQGFKNSNLLKIDRVGVDVSVMPLLSRELVIGNVALDGAEIYLETLKDGRSNLDTLTKKKTEQGSETAKADSSAASAAAEQQPAKENQSWKINLAGVSVTNASLEIRDDVKGSYTKLYDVGLSVSEFVFDQWTSVQFAAKGKNNQQQFSAEGKAEFKLAQDLTDYALRDIALDATFKDPTTDISSVKVTLDTFVFDQLNKLTLAVKGKAAEMDIDMSLSSDLLVDKAISKVSMQNMSLNSQLIGASLPQSQMTITADSDFSFDLNKQFVSLILNKLTMNKIAVDGKASVQLAEIPAVRFSVHSPEIDLDEFLGLNKTEQAASEPSTEGEKSPEPAVKEPEQEPDLSALKTLDIAGEVTIDKFKANNVHMQNVQSRFSVNRGVVKLSKFHSDLYQGSIDATAYLDGRKVPATYWAKKQIKNVKVQPLLKDAADNDMLEGTGNIDVDVKGSSLKPSAIKKNLAGIIKIKFADGAINGINIAQIIRVNYAKIKGKQVPEDANDSKKTDFSAMGATLKLSKGVMTTNDLSVQSPLLRLHGEGKVNYIDETMDMELNTSIVGSLEGQGGKDIDELRDVTIPVRLYGQWAKPQYDIELDKLWKKLQEEKKLELKIKAEKELDKYIGDNIKDENTRKLTEQLLNGLFN